ncbi:sulfur carrier protein ThiS adenylyltransferase ThiF [bacterium]|nr:sulfur carrier protein ThiS adenylyltransferase ThiF [bacterium]
MSANTYLTDRERAILESANIGIAGAGGLGSNCASHLVRAGIRKLTIADFDTVSESNLNRQFFFRHQIGEKKIAALAENLRLIEPDLDLSLCGEMITPENAKSVFSSCDIVVEAFDSSSAKMMLISALRTCGKPIVSASGLAGWGRSNDIRLNRVGGNLFLIGDGESDVKHGIAPVSPRVGIAAAMEANTVVALLLGEKI